MTRLGATWVVALLIVRTWFNGLCRAIGSRRGGACLVLLVATLLGGWLVLGTHALTAQVDFDPRDAAVLAGPVAAQLFALPALVALFGAIAAPDRTHLGDLLALLPVPAPVRVAAPRYLCSALGVVVGGVWAFPLAWGFATALPGVQPVLALTCCGLIALLGALSAQLSYTVVESVGRFILGVSTSTVRGVGGAAVALVVAWMLLLALPIQGRVESAGPVVLVAAPLGWTATEVAPAFSAVLVLAASVTLATLALAAADMLPRPQVTRPLSRRFRVPGPPARTLVSLDIVQWLRFPTNATFLVFNVVILGVVLITVRQADADAWFEVAALFLALASTVGVGSFGSTRAAHWIFNVSGRPRGWIAPKLAGVALLWSTLIATMMVLFTSTTSWNESDALSLLPTLALEMVVGCVVGLVIPVGREQSFGSAASEVVAVLVVLSVAVGVQALPWMDSTIGIVLTHAVGLATALTLYVAVARERSSRPLAGVA